MIHDDNLVFYHDHKSALKVQLVMNDLFIMPMRGSVREGWLYQIGWIFGKVPNEEGGRLIFNPKFLLQEKNDDAEDVPYHN